MHVAETVQRAKLIQNARDSSWRRSEDKRSALLQVNNWSAQWTARPLTTCCTAHEFVLERCEFERQYMRQVTQHTLTSKSLLGVW
jgi:hypothetical protein